MENLEVFSSSDPHDPFNNPVARSPKKRGSSVRNLVLAAKNGEEDTVTEILKSGEVDVDSRWKWETALMVSARTNNINLCRILLSFGADCNVSRVMQQTPLWIAAYHGNLEIMELMIATRKCSQVNLDNALRRCVTMNFLHGCDTLLRAGADVEATDSMAFTSLHVAAGSNEEFEAPKSDHWKYQNQDSWRLYHATSFETCELLIMWKADVNALDSTKETPLHYACETGNEDICRLLIENGAEINAASGHNKKTPLHVAVSKDFPQLVKTFLENPNIQPKITDGEGETPLMSAIQLHKKECVKVFLEDDRWSDFMSVINKSLLCKNEVVDTPMRLLIRHMPDMANMVMNKCIELSSHKDPRNPEFTVRFNFAFLDDTYTCAHWFSADDDIATTSLAMENGHGKTTETTPTSTLLGRKVKLNDALPIPHNISSGNLRRKQTIIDPGIRPGGKKKTYEAPVCDPRCFNCSKHTRSCKLNAKVKEYTNNRRTMMTNHPLFIAYHEKNNSILCHPLAIALVNYKWNKIARYPFYGGLFMYFIFVGLLTTHVMIRHSNETNNTNADDGHDVAIERASNVTLVILMGICAFAILKEIINIVTEFPSYLLVFGHWADLAIYITATVIVAESAVDKCSLTNHPLAAICIFAAWFNVMLTLRQFPVIGIFFIMFTRILKSSLIVLLVFFPLILGFAFTFSIILDKAMPLFKFDKSIATILVMLSGEVEFVDTMTNGAGKGLKSSITYKNTAIVIYVFFIVLMVIGLLNLLVGLAVSDVDTLQTESRAEMMSLRAEKVMSIEHYLISIPRRRAACGCLTYRPNKRKLCFGKDRSSFKIPERVKAWFNVLEFNDSRLSPAYLIKIMRTEKPDNNYDFIRREIANLKVQLMPSSASVLSPPRVSRFDSHTRSSKRFEVPGARVLKKTNGITHDNRQSTNDDAGIKV